MHINPQGIPDQCFMIPSGITNMESTFLDSLSFVDMNQINYVVNARNRLLDLVFVSGNFVELQYNLNESQDSLVNNDEHHKSILLSITLDHISFRSQVKSEFINYKYGNYYALNSFLCSVNWFQLFDGLDLDLAVGVFHDVLNRGPCGIEMCIPRHIQKK